MQNGSGEPFPKRTYIFIPQAFELIKAVFLFTSLQSLLFLAPDFNKSTVEAELQCGDQTCFDRSVVESKICKPFVKSTTKVNKVVLVLLLMKAFSFCLMVCFDFVLLKLPKKGHKNPRKRLSTLLFVVSFATIILYLSSTSFNKLIFCSMNMKERICKTQGKFRHKGAMHTIEDPIYVSAPCKIFPVGSDRDSDILVIDQTISPCSLELRSKFFIENFEMSTSVNPNDFVLLDGEPLEFASGLDFFSWSKQGSAELEENS